MSERDPAAWLSEHRDAAVLTVDTRTGLPVHAIYDQPRVTVQWFNEIADIHPSVQKQRKVNPWRNH